MSSLGQMKINLHDRLWNAQQRWFAMRREGWTKHQVKIAGVREFGEQNHHMRPILFAGRTRVTYERALKSFIEFAHEKFGVQRLDDIDTKHAKAFLEDGIQRGLAAKTLHTYRSALSKLAALTGHTASGVALSTKYGQKIRDLVKVGNLYGPTRQTPSLEVVRSSVEILKGWDARHFERTDEPRAYHLAARLQLETSCRSISATARVTANSLSGANQITLAGKGGRSITFVIFPELHRLLTLYFTVYPGPLADRHAYQSAYARSVRAAGGRVTGTHGLRRLSARQFYRTTYHQAVRFEMSPADAAAVATGDAIQRLGHGRNRQDVAGCYVPRAA